jgi:hypothetical protein
MALIVISSAFLLAVASCKKSNNSGSSGTSISATVNGTAWSSNLGIIGFYSTAGAGGQFSIEGGQLKSADTTAFELTFYSPFTKNQVVSSDTAEIGLLYTDVQSNLTYQAGFNVGHFILTITSYDSTANSIGGTFSGELYNDANYSDSIPVTNGKFNSTFTVN